MGRTAETEEEIGVAGKRVEIWRCEEQPGSEGVSFWVPLERLDFDRRRETSSLHISMEGDFDRLSSIWCLPLSQWGGRPPLYEAREGSCWEERIWAERASWWSGVLVQVLQVGCMDGHQSAQHPSTQHPRHWQSLTGTPPSHSWAASLPPSSCWGNRRPPGRGVTCPPFSPVLFWIDFLRSFPLDFQEHCLGEMGKKTYRILTMFFSYFCKESCNSPGQCAGLWLARGEGIEEEKHSNWFTLVYVSEMYTCTCI